MDPWSSEGSNVGGRVGPRKSGRKDRAAKVGRQSWDSKAGMREAGVAEWWEWCSHGDAAAVV